MKHRNHFRNLSVVLLICLSVAAGGFLSLVANQPTAAAQPASEAGLDAQSGVVEKLSKDRSVELAQAPKTRPTTKPAGLTSEQMIAELARLTNAERTKAGLPEFQVTNANLLNAAAIRAKEIAVRFDHIRPNGTFFTSVLIDCNVNFSASAENILYASAGLSPSSVIQSWMASTGHRTNILNASYTDLGIGYYRSGKYDYFVQLFVKGY